LFSSIQVSLRAESLACWLITGRARSFYNKASKT